jgi:hypothetical protein
MIRHIFVDQLLEFCLFCGFIKCFIGTVFCLFVKTMGDKLLEQRNQRNISFGTPTTLTWFDPVWLSHVPESRKYLILNHLKEKCDSSAEDLQKIVSCSVSRHGKDVCVLNKVMTC